MKIKQLDKKLSLGKKTVANLDKDELNKYYGGQTDYFSCYMDPSCMHYTDCPPYSCTMCQ